MDIRAAIGLSQEMARNICSIHISNGNATAPHCISCDQEYPCSTLQFAKTIEMITVTAVRGPGTHRPMLNAMEKWVIDALQTSAIALACCLTNEAMNIHRYLSN